MDKIKAIAVVLITLSVFSGVITSFIPSKRYLKILKIILSCIVILTFFSLINGIDVSDFSLDENVKSQSIERAHQIETKIDSAVIDMTASQVQDYINSMLSQKGIKTNYISVLMDRTDKADIYIKEIKIILDDEQKYLKEAVEVFLKGFIGEEIILTIG